MREVVTRYCAHGHAEPCGRDRRQRTIDKSIRQSSGLALLQRRRDSPHEDNGAAHARKEARGLAWLEVRLELGLGLWLGLGLEWA